MFLGPMAATARRRALRDAVASVSRHAFSAAGRACPQAAEGSAFARRAVKEHTAKVASIGWRAPAARLFSGSAFPPPFAIRAPVDQITYTNRDDMVKDTFDAASEFLKEDDVFQKLHLNPLLKGKVSRRLVGLGTLRQFVVSSMGITFENHQLGISVAISFTEDNMEVSSRYKEVRLKEAWGYKLNRGRGITIGTTWMALAQKIDAMVRKVHPDVEYPVGFAYLLRKMTTVPYNEAMEILLLHHVSLLSSEDYIRFIGDAEILLKRKLPLYRRDPKVQSLLDRLYFRISNLSGYDKAHWRVTINKHKFLLDCADFSEISRDSRRSPIDLEERLLYNLKRGKAASRISGGLAAVLKSGAYLLDSYDNNKKLALLQISVQRDAIFHLFELLQVMYECFPYSREEMAEAVRAILPMPAVIIQEEVFDAGLFNTEMRMTSYRSVSPLSLRRGFTMSTDHVLVFIRPRTPIVRRKGK